MTRDAKSLIPHATVELRARELLAQQRADLEACGPLRLSHRFQLAGFALMCGCPHELPALLEGAELQPTTEPELNWLDFSRQCVWASWLAVLRHGPGDGVRAISLAVGLRAQQVPHEGACLSGFADARDAKDAALELMALYFCVTAAERLAESVLMKSAPSEDACSAVEELLGRAQRCAARMTNRTAEDMVGLARLMCRWLCQS